MAEFLEHPAIGCAMDTGFAPYALPRIVGRCVGCGEAVCDGDGCFRTDEGRLVHEECFLDYVLDRFGADSLAEELGYERVG